MYRLTQQSNTIQRLSDNAFIPFDGGNMDYQAYLEWLNAGNQPEPYVPPPPQIPTQVTAYQAKMALLNANLYAQSNSAVYNSNNQSIIIAWEYASVFERDSPFIQSIQPTLNLSNNQIDDLFISASKIT